MCFSLLVFLFFAEFYVSTLKWRLVAPLDNQLPAERTFSDRIGATRWLTPIMTQNWTISNTILNQRNFLFFIVVNGGVKFGHCGGAKVGQFGASALERAALI
jgi:hypothetical protein